MDTRTKIVAVADLVGVVGGRAARIVVGHFDPVYSAHVRRLRQLEDQRCLVAVVTEGLNPIMESSARAEVLAGLDAVDWVVISGAEAVIAVLPEAEVIREEAGDRQRTRDLIAYVHERQPAV